MANIAVQRIKREFKEVVKSEEVGGMVQHKRVHESGEPALSLFFCTVTTLHPLSSSLLPPPRWRVVILKWN